jgi:DNA topoisomerase VI subunit A
MYREPRGSIYHPHTGEDIPLGTLTVEDYERPIWTYNKLLYVEKEGFSEALKADGWPERHDCALMSSKGFTTRAARDLVDKLAEHNEPVTIFCVHDADAYGTISNVPGRNEGARRPQDQNRQSRTRTVGSVRR